MPNRSSFSVVTTAGTHGIVMPKKVQRVSTGGTTHMGGNSGIDMPIELVRAFFDLVLVLRVF